MTLLSLVISAASFALMAWGAFGLIRNEFVYRVRFAILNLPSWSDAGRLYYALPSYSEMLHNPRYWLLWTKEHWIAWLARRSDVDLGRSLP